MVISIGYVACHIEWRLAIFMLGVIVPIFIVMMPYGKFVKKIQKQISDARAELTEIGQEAFSNVRTVKAFASEDNESCKFYDKN